MSGPSSSFDGGQSPAGMSASGDIGSPSGDTRGSEDNASTPTNSPSNASETAHNDRLIEEAVVNDAFWRGFFIVAFVSVCAG